MPKLPLPPEADALLRRVLSLTVSDAPDWYRQLTLFGRVDEIRDDADFADIDRLSLRYSRRPFRNRLRARISALIVPERWYGWEGSSHWP